ncbi:nuclear transport factor 2 family protein [Streptomyces spinoverrucosus]|uniref:YybH family protein n=1 Tax=Streptomyces spinoverrucosus TaxID=284043 RepID=UPI0018C36746|nr:nuclear transport factor 2 family protein [Streptomyces spinoverrucosus]MBG0856946.1 nuclear transport factor 2 family protein [Streptomyces spinoverrucosus]
MAQLTNEVEKHTALYVEAFNAGDADAVNAMYTDEAVAVWEPGVPLTGQARVDAVREFLSHGPRMTAVPRQSFVTGDTALLIVDWTIDTTDADGNPERLSGVGADVLRLGADGNWRYAVDDPYGGK